MAEEQSTTQPPGPGVDAAGRPVKDPTENVRELVEAALLRQDDLRAAEFRRQDDLRELETKHRQEVEQLRWKYDTELRAKETERIDSIRAVDVQAVQRAAEVSATQAQTLATQVATSAETLRTQVAAAAQASTVALAAALDPVKNDIADLRKTQYEQAGQRAQTQEAGIGARAWVAIAVAAVIGFGTLILGVAGIVITLLLTGQG